MDSVKETSETNSPLSLQKIDIFKKYYDEGKISEVDFQTIPLAVRNYFITKSQQYTKPTAPTFPLSVVIEHPNGDKTFAVTNSKTLDTNGETDWCIYLGDTDANGNLTGRGEIIRNMSPDKGVSYYNKPFVGYTSTEKDYQNKGLGTRRYVIMNALSQMVHQLPLYSGTSTSEEAEAVWEKLIEKGLAEENPNKKSMKYVFKMVL